MSSAHTQIVFALSLCGLFIDKHGGYWPIIAFARWDILADGISSIIRNGRLRSYKQIRIMKEIMLPYILICLLDSR